MNFIPLKSGKSVEGDEIKAYKSETKGPSWIYIMAGVHGDEVEGVYVVQKLYEWLQNQEDIQRPTVIIPILNVDGYRAGTRTNAHAVDLNRNLPSKDWTNKGREAKYNPGTKPLSEPENIYLDKLFQKYPPKLIMSFHSWKPFINTNGDCLEVAQFLERYNNYEIVQDEIAGHPTPGSLGEYAQQEYNSPVITFECPLLASGKSLKEIWDENAVGLQALMRSNLLD
ncbi:MAG: hypothetical protein CME71_07850 [Halobacteriovorax sp.]|nr:hypothetical protein [Halobacteriovorax sp.]|tara:strand:+ start:275 stop:952 length:678 start_codon:yes stop_codon:yes gene_type:complete